MSPYSEGYHAYETGDPCPYEEYTFESAEWWDGYNDAENYTYLEESYYDQDDYEDNYIGDDYYSGTGELIGDESYITYLNNY